MSKDGQPPGRGSFALRTGRWSAPEHSYFITASTFHRQPIFVDPVCCQIVFDRIDWLEKEGKLEYCCCIIMPDHIHLVIELESGGTLRQVMQSLKGYTALKINQQRHQRGHVWQEQYYDHLIRNEEDLRSTITYCYENPARMGLVQNAGDYPFWRCKFVLV